MATAAAELLDEAGLVRRAQAGDRDAYLALYQAYSTRIYDFVLRMARNRADAEDITSDVFLKAMERLGKLSDPGAFKGWLYAIARNTALSAIEGRGRMTPVAEHHDSAQPADASSLPAPDAKAEEAELQRLVWEAASTLNPRDYSVFELAIRHGLGSSEIAEALDVRPAYAYILVNRLKKSISEALEALLLARTGRRDCAELDRLLLGFGDESSPRLRKAVSRHARSCETCARTRKGRASVPSLLQGTAWAEPSADFSEGLARRIAEQWGTPSAHVASNVVAQSLGQFIAAIGIMVLTAALFVGVGAQRSIHEIEEVPARVASETEELPEPSAEPEEQQGVPAPERRSEPEVRRPVVIVDRSGDEQSEEGDVDVDQDVEVDNEPDAPSEPPRDGGKDQPQEDPPQSEPPVR